MNRRIVTALIAIGLAVGSANGALAADASHEGHASAPAGLTLNHGQKWGTDQSLRQGMTGVRGLMSEAMPLIHAGRYQTTDYGKLADGINGHVQSVVANCKLPEDADAQLHLVLVQIMDGADMMKTDKAQLGAEQVVKAMDAYGEHFAHPGWKPLPH